MTCEGCGKPLGPMDVGYTVCFECTKARAKTACTGGRCHCGRKARPGSPRRVYSRSWIPCHRCLGTIRQVA